MERTNQSVKFVSDAFYFFHGGYGPIRMSLLLLFRWHLGAPRAVERADILLETLPLYSLMHSP